MEQKTFIEASNANNIHVEKKCFLQLLNLKVYESLIFQTKQQEVLYTFACISLLYISII